MRPPTYLARRFLEERRGTGHVHRAAGTRPARTTGRARARRADEEGFTLIEGMIVVIVFAILLAITIPIVSTLFQTQSRINVTYSNTDEQIWLSTTFQRLVRGAVAPAPAYTTAWVSPPPTPFVQGEISPTSVWFYANTGTTKGPVLVKASCTATTTHPTYCKSPTSKFTVTITPPKSGTCPTTETSASVCTWTSKTARTLIVLTNVRNGANSTPLFVYTYGSAPGLGKPLATTTVCFAAHVPTPCTGTYTDATIFETGTTHCKVASTPTSLRPFTTCPAGEIDEVSYDLQINGNTTSTYGGEQAEDSTGTFVLSSTSMNFNPAVG
jgi:prepilin-type N-terminal cleavage/methylation domain-containing protein